MKRREFFKAISAAILGVPLMAKLLPALAGPQYQYGNAMAFAYQYNGHLFYELDYPKIGEPVHVFYYCRDGLFVYSGTKIGQPLTIKTPPRFSQWLAQTEVVNG